MRPLCECNCGQDVNYNRKKKCYNLYVNGHNMRGKTMPKSAIEKLRIANLGVRNPNYGNIGEKSATFGRRHTENEISKIIMKRWAQSSPNIVGINRYTKQL